MTKRYSIYFILAVGLFSFLNFSTLKNGHNWGDDFAQYILQAKNIAGHRPYMDGITREEWSVNPPGFPCLLVPFIKIFGVNFKILKSLNIAAWLLFCCAMYCIAKRRIGKETGFLFFLAVLSLPSFFIFKQNILSDLPFLPFSTFSLYLLLRYEDGLSKPRGSKGQHFLWGAGCLMLGGYLIRPAGIVLFICAFFYFALIKKDRRVIVPFFIFLCAAIAIQHHFKTFNGYWYEFPTVPDFWHNLFTKRFGSVFSALFLEHFLPRLGLFLPIFFTFKKLITAFAPLLFILMAFDVIRRLQKNTLGLLGLFFFLYLSAVIFWPIEGGPRYVFPLVGFTILFAIERIIKRRLVDAAGPTENGSPLNKNRQHLAHLCLILFLLHNIFITWIVYPFDDDTWNKPSVRQMATWIKEETARDEYFMFSKPRALALLTGHVGIAPWLFPEQKNGFDKRLEKFRIRYIVSGKTQEDLLEKISNREKKFQKVWENSEFVIFKVGL